jgi:hypothetical protein
MFRLWFVLILYRMVEFLERQAKSDCLAIGQSGAAPQADGHNLPDSAVSSGWMFSFETTASGRAPAAVRVSNR